MQSPYALMAASPAGAVVAVLLGLLWGSFANVCIYRWPPTDEFPKGRSVVLPASHCFVCKTPIRWYDNVPLLSYLWLRGACRSCKTQFSSRYLIVEAVTGLLFGVAWWVWLASPARTISFETQLLGFLVTIAFSFTLVVIAFIDLDHQLILDKVTFPSVILFYVGGLVLPGQHVTDGLIGAAVGYGTIWLIGEIFYRLTGREGMGLGDAKLLAVVGAFLGWRGVVAAIGVGSLIGTVVGIPVLLFQRMRRGDKPADPPKHAHDHEQSDESIGRTALPFGPFLVTATLMYLLAEPWIRSHILLLGYW